MTIANLVWICLSYSVLVQAAFIDPQYKLVEWTGWGTSLAWFSDVLGGMDQDVQDEIITAFFARDKLNLNVLRYTIGGTTPGDRSCGEFRDGAATESFRDSPNDPYIWSRDPRARKVLLAARNLGADVFEAFSNSPPSWLTRNGCTKGTSTGAPLHDNFDPENSEAFADYLTEVVKYYHENYNVSFAYLAPFNEPSSGYWGGEQGTQEGCNMERSTMVDVIRATSASLSEKNLTFCKLSVADETQINQELATQKYFTNAGIASLYEKVNTHGYSDDGKQNRVELYTLADKNRHVLWMDEVGWGRSSLEEMSQGISLAERIITDLRNMVPSAWVYWQVMEDQSPGKWGLVDVPYHNATVGNIQYNSGYYAMMQFSKFIRRGFTIIHVNDNDSVAAYDESKQILVIVTLNAGSSQVSKYFDLNMFSSLGSIEAYRTSPTEPQVSINPPNIIGKELTFELPPRSVTTIQISAAISNLASNLLINGDFETGTGQGWFLMYGNRDDFGVNGFYVRRGRYSGSVDYNQSELSLMQNVTVAESKRYYLSAWCATNGGNTKFGILLNGQQGPEITLVSGLGYRLYGLSVDAKQSDVLSIYLYSRKGNSNAQIDDVELH